MVCSQMNGASVLKNCTSRYSQFLPSDFHLLSRSGTLHIFTITTNSSNRNLPIMPHPNPTELFAAQPVTTFKCVPDFDPVGYYNVVFAMLVVSIAPVVSTVGMAIFFVICG
jgi:hypothetical protein